MSLKHLCREKLGEIGGEKLTMSQQYALATKKASSILDYIKKIWPHSTPISGVLCPCQDSPLQERHGNVGASPEKGPDEY